MKIVHVHILINQKLDVDLTIELLLFNYYPTSVIHYVTTLKQTNN